MGSRGKEAGRQLEGGSSWRESGVYNIQRGEGRGVDKEHRAGKERVGKGWTERSSWREVRCMMFKAHTSVCLPLRPVVWRVGAPVSTAVPLH